MHAIWFNLAFILIKMNRENTQQIQLDAVEQRSPLKYYFSHNAIFVARISCELSVDQQYLLFVDKQNLL